MREGLRWTRQVGMLGLYKGDLQGTLSGNPTSKVHLLIRTQACRRLGTTVSRPRTQAHIESCYAVCTKCYLIRAPANPAPLQATWQSRNLAVQHAGCGHQSKGMIGGVLDLCQSCYKLGSEGIMRVREERDMASLKRLLDIRLRCKECEKSLPRGSRRWWICGKGGHDCHWAGHEVGR